MPASEPAVCDLSDDALLTRVDVSYVRAHAAMAHWLTLIAEVDRRRLWAYDGHPGLASWLRWKYRLCRQTSKEKARVARGATVWPAAFTAFANGDIAYSSLRHIIRLPTHDPDTEARLIDVATHGTADDVARLVNRAVDLHRTNQTDTSDQLADATADGGDGDSEEVTPPEPDPFAHRRLWAARTLDGYVTGGFTLAPAEGALFLAALDTYLDNRRPGAADSKGVAAATPHIPTPDDPRTIDQKRADGFSEMVAAYLAAQPPTPPAPIATPSTSYATSKPSSPVNGIPIPAPKPPTARPSASPPSSNSVVTAPSSAFSPTRAASST